MPDARKPTCKVTIRVRTVGGGSPHSRDSRQILAPTNSSLVKRNIMKQILDYDPFTIEPKIGYWEAMCCELDTFLIRDTDDGVFDVEHRQECSQAVFKNSYDAALFFFADGNNSYESKTVEDLEAKIIKYDKEVHNKNYEES